MENNSLLVTGYTPDGFKITLNIGIDMDDSDIRRLIDALEVVRLCGITPSPVELPSGSNIEDIDVVIMSRHEQTPKAYLYKSNLEHKIGHLYLNTPEEVALFERATAKLIADFPVYEGDSAPTRKERQPHRMERAVKPFQIIKTLKGAYDNGMPKYEYRLHAVLGDAPTKPANPFKPMTEDEPEPQWTEKVAIAWRKENAMYTDKDILAALGLQSKLGEWKFGVKTANQKLAAWKQSQGSL